MMVHGRRVWRWRVVVRLWHGRGLVVVVRLWHGRRGRLMVVVMMVFKEHRWWNVSAVVFQRE